MDELIAPLLEHLDREDPGTVVGVYLYGSATTSGLRADSDIDLLMLTRHSLTAPERAALVSLLLSISGRHGHAGRFPDAAHRRPIELTSVVMDDIQPLTETPRRDFQYGEWLRDDLAGGHLPQPTGDPDAVVVLATAHSAHRVLRGPALGDVVASVPATLLRNAVIAVIPDIVEGIDGDERNALLTLARILVTLDTGQIVSKDAAAAAIVQTLTATDRDLLERARGGYLGTIIDDWTGLVPRVTALARTLACRAQQHSPTQ